jgi:hypothetical protein
MNKSTLAGTIFLTAAMMGVLDARQDTRMRSSREIRDRLQSMIESAHDPDLRWPDSDPNARERR